MGCDIHWVLEKRTNGRWVGMASSSVVYSKAKQRFYQFFVELGQSYRGHSDEAEKLNGVPQDASELALLEIEEMSGDAHSHSFLPLDRFGAAYNRAIKKSPFPGKKIDKPSNLFGEYFWPDEGDEYRVVFWFDN